MPRLPRIVIQNGFLAGGQIECDSQEHFMVRLDAAKHGLPQKTLVGVCTNYEACKQMAADLAKREAEEAAKLAQPAAPPSEEEKG